MAAEEHPTQGVCDLAVLSLAFGDLSGIRLLYVGGGGNNTATALAHGLAAVSGAEVTFATPPGYGLPAGALATARANAKATGARIEEIHASGTRRPGGRRVHHALAEPPAPASRTHPGGEAFRPFHVGRSAAGAVAAGALPARPARSPGRRGRRRGLDGPRSLAWTQAAMKLPSAMAVLEQATGSLPG
ncbi:hypothetical protein LT493_08930 [Streptomyces tricolor]|nr:hypothetical protein [Streptomyces tricolor]